MSAAAFDGPEPGVAPPGEYRLGLRALADVRARNVRWLLPGLIPLDTLTSVAGLGGLGKSTWLAGVSAQTSRGDLLGGEPGDVLIVSFEDPAAEVLRPRIEAAQGDLSRVHEVVVEGLAGIDPVRLPQDVAELERLVLMVQAKLVIIDPIVAAIDARLDAHKDQHVRGVLAELAELAENTGCAIALVGHLNKAPSTDAYILLAQAPGRASRPGVAGCSRATAVVLPIVSAPHRGDHPADEDDRA